MLILKGRATLCLLMLGIFLSSNASADILIKYMAFLNGECISAKQNDEDITEQCKKGKATNTSYQNGRAAFSFVSDFPVSFSGGKDAQPAADNYKLEVDQVLTVISGTPVSWPAVGSCSVTGDITNKATITCEATINGKNSYKVVFESTGNAEMIYGVGFEPFDINKNIDFAIRDFDRIYSAQGIDGVEAFLKSCYPAALESHWLPAFIKCASIDYAGNFLDMLIVKNTGNPARPYFTKEATQLRVKENISREATQKSSEQVEKILQVTQGLSIKSLSALIKAKTNK
ncbi:hypothetical protein [Methylophilus sp. YYY-1]|jgi:hypothetical protein|uniref:hypothetical protein n=1 Tax=Methylophilus sp. YYY-1 TaxID=2682087 RepID=UPI0023B20791|nr:hypothetical protein [Methylophilus sp. YYY-1]MDF0379312.1 hypothetical protein [Methylophilus sp. YYY-1]